jgi:MraZ protein
MNRKGVAFGLWQWPGRRPFLLKTGRSGFLEPTFRGAFPQKVDSKGRVSIPADFRRVLELGDPAFAQTQTPRLVLLYGPHLKNCLHVYTIDAMAQIERDINALPRGSVQRKMASRMILSNSWETTVDRDGRIVLPKERRLQINLGAEAYMAAMGDYFEIWDSAAYAADADAEVQAFLDAQEDGFDPLSLTNFSGGAPE